MGFSPTTIEHFLHFYQTVKCDYQKILFKFSLCGCFSEPLRPVPRNTAGHSTSQTQRTARPPGTKPNNQRPGPVVVRNS